MIQLRTDCLVFETASGSIPCSAEQVAVELVGDAANQVDTEILRHAAAGVLHYFKEELGRDFVTIAEFSNALARVLRGFGLEVLEATPDPAGTGSAAALDLQRLVAEPGADVELVFFRRLREEMARHLAARPHVLRLSGLRASVKQLLAARRWSPRCRDLQYQIVAFLRECLREQSGVNCTLIAE